MLRALKPSSPSSSATSQSFAGHVPARVVMLDAVDERALVRVNAFLDWFAELPLCDWLSVGRSMSTATASTTRPASGTVLDAMIANHGLRVQAWHVRDSIETVAFLVSHCAPSMARADRRAFVAVRCAAEEAALALLARDHLSPADFAALVSPFNGAAWAQRHSSSPSHPGRRSLRALGEDVLADHRRSNQGAEVEATPR